MYECKAFFHLVAWIWQNQETTKYKSSIGACLCINILVCTLFFFPYFCLIFVFVHARDLNIWIEVFKNHATVIANNTRVCYIELGNTLQPLMCILRAFSTSYSRCCCVVCASHILSLCVYIITLLISFVACTILHVFLRVQVSLKSIWNNKKKNRKTQK